ncbi:hypothetical protein [Collimonas sp. OK307]|uniref:hypothetical protein n=1 Tax=Collimonas sp. OK307 TaxID=1801620 RepID=UPI001113B734|nr:hypothetical protein [Collimonas sp. OK307]
MPQLAWLRFANTSSHVSANIRNAKRGLTLIGQLGQRGEKENGSKASGSSLPLGLRYLSDSAKCSARFFAELAELAEAG